MAKKKHRQPAGAPVLVRDDKVAKLVVTLDPAVLAELRRRHEETGATMAELVRRAVKYWIAGTKEDATLSADRIATSRRTR